MPKLKAKAKEPKDAKDKKAPVEITAKITKIGGKMSPQAHMGAAQAALAQMGRG
jgi:hypothetical protein